MASSFKQDNPGCDCCGPCTCPDCAMSDHNTGVIDPVTGINSKARCRLYWGCCDCEGCEVRLAGETYDHGVVPASGSIAAVDGETYTIISTGPDCTTQTITFEMENECPCATGCMTGQVIGAKQSAVLTVSNFGFGQQISTPLGRYRVDEADLSDLNHTLTCSVLTATYLDGDDTCAVDYIAPVTDYFIAQIQIFSYVYTADPGSGGTLLGTSWVKWDVYGTMTTASSVGSATVSNGRVFQLYLQYNSRSLYTDAVLGTVTPPPGSSGIVVSEHTYTTGTIALDLTFTPPSAGSTLGHWHWCDERMTIGRFGSLGNTVPNPWVPSGWFGLFQWDSLI